MQGFPLNPATCLLLAEIAVELEAVNPDTIFGAAIHMAIKNDGIVEAVMMIRAEANDNYPLVCDIVGYKTLNKIYAL